MCPFLWIFITTGSSNDFKSHPKCIDWHHKQLGKECMTLGGPQKDGSQKNIHYWYFDPLWRQFWNKCVHFCEYLSPQGVVMTSIVTQNALAYIMTSRRRGIYIRCMMYERDHNYHYLRIKSLWTNYQGYVRKHPQLSEHSILETIGGNLTCLG